jgi:tight adherence protein B
MFGSFTVLIAVAGLAALSAGSLAYVFLYGRIESENRAEQRIGLVQGQNTGDTQRARGVVDAARRRKSVQDTLKEVEEKQKAKAKSSNSPPLKLRMEQAGLAWTKRTFFIISLVLGVIIAFAVWLAGAPVWAAAALGLAGLLGAPRWYVNFRRKRRLKKFLDEFANAMDVIVRGVKSGLPLNDCIKIIANEAAEPVKSEFRFIIETQSLGVPLAEAVAKLAERVPVPESSFFAIVIAIQQRAGGNLSEALGNLSRVLRDRKRMKGKIGAMSQEAKASAGIIGALPVVVMVLVYLSSPKYIMLLFTEQLGNVILGASAIWMFLGILVMRKMINFDY